MKVVRPIGYEVPDQNLMNKMKRERFKLWLEMIENKRDRSLNRADRNIK
jgi:hypothetical protein